MNERTKDDGGQGGTTVSRGGDDAGAPAAEPVADTRSAGDEIHVDAPPERVWRALTEAAELVRWFPLDAAVEPGEGGSLTLSWRNEFRATSEILAWEPHRCLRTGWGDWHGEGMGQVTEYRLESSEGGTFLRVVTSGFPQDAAWDDWVEGTRRGWRFELRSLKRYLEAHAGRDRSVVYLRRRVGLSHEDAWERIVAADALGWPPVEGEAFDVEPPVHFAAHVDDPADGLFRLSVERSSPEIDARDVVLWLQTWGDGERPTGIEDEWSALLERTYPEGETP